jgi:hypothetical protein
LLGFDFHPSGTISLKAYYVTAFCPPTNQMQVAPDTGKPLDKLVAQLHPTLSQPFEAVKLYIEGIEAPRRPYAGIAAMDCVQPDVNRLKVGPLCSRSHPALPTLPSSLCFRSTCTDTRAPPGPRLVRDSR